MASTCAHLQSVCGYRCTWSSIGRYAWGTGGEELVCLFGLFAYFPAGICLLKVNNRNTRTKCEICSKLTIKTPERRQLNN